METSVVDVARYPNALQPKETLPLFQPKTASEEGKLWSELVPGHLIITPDENGVIVSDPGRVRHFHFTGKSAGKSDVIIKHQCMKKIPLIAVAQQQDKPLVVVSACNYYSKQDRKLVAEYAVYSHGSYDLAQMDSPIQAISLNASGDTLAIADLLSVTLIDLNTKERHQSRFKRKVFDGSHRIVDIAMNAQGNNIVIAGSHGDIQLMSCNQDLSDLSNDKQVKTSDKIKKIYYPCSGDSHSEDSASKYGELFYLTDQREAKIVKIGELNEKDTDQHIDTVFFAKSSKYDKVAADLGGQIAIAYWTDDIKMDQKVRKKIKIYRKDCKGSMDELTLELPDVEEFYNYRTISGTLDEGVGHLLYVVLRGKTVIALATDGRLRFWSLPEMRAIEQRNQMKGRSRSAQANSNPLISFTGDSIQKRNRSSSTKIIQSAPDVLGVSEKQKKTSPRIGIPSFLKSSGGGSPTHRSESTGHHEKDVKHG
jgi:hypothetical protein